MNKKLMHALILSIFLPFFHPTIISAKSQANSSNQETAAWRNDIPPRLQWNANFGYCGEVSFISAGLYYGQYLSQYTARAVASQNTPQYLRKSQLLLGVNDQYAAEQMHLNAVVWNTKKGKRTNQFLKWVKKNVLKGFPVVIGIYTNEYLFYGIKNPNAGDPDYDHIVSVFGIGSNQPLKSSGYNKNDIIYFSDNGLWGSPVDPPYIFSYPVGQFQASRREANSKNGNIYSLANDGKNYGIKFTGVMDLNGDTLPVRVTTNRNDEEPEIKNGTNIEPPPMPLMLTITVSHLEPGVPYNLYRYNQLDLVPNSNFNGLADQAYEHWSIQIDTGTAFVMTQNILSDEIADYRAVRASTH